MIDDRSTSDRQGFVVAATPTDEIWDKSLKVVAIQLQETGWNYCRTSPHPLTGLKPAEIAFHGKTGQALISIYQTFDSLIPEHMVVTDCHTPLSSLKRVLEIE